MATGTIKTVKGVSYFDYTLSSAENVPNGSAVRFAIPLQTGETNVRNRLNVIALENQNVYCVPVESGRLYVINQSGSAQSVLKFRVNYFS